MHTTRRAALALLLAICVALLSACGARPQSAQQPADVSLPEPQAEADEMFLGERQSQRRHEANLYYISADGTELSPVSRTVYVPEGGSLVEAVLRALLSPPGGYNQIAVVPGDTQLLSLEQSGGIVTANLSVDARGVQTDQELYLMYAAISATLLDLEGVTGVNVLIGGQSECVYRLPMGLLCNPPEAAVSALAQIQAESERFLAGDYSLRGSITRSAPLYYPSVSGDLALPEARTFSFTDDDYAEALLEALRVAPAEDSGCVSPLPPVGALLDEPARVHVAETGARTLELAFSGDVVSYLTLRDISPSQFAAAITLTMTSFVPELDCVRIALNGEPLEAVETSGAEIALKNGLHRRQTYSDAVGGSMTMYFAGSDGGLRAVNRVVTQACAASPRLRLEQLFFGPVAGEEDASPLPEGVSALDVLGVEVEDGVARVNLSGNFYRRCQALDAVGERRAAYAIVNTLCDLDWISGVRLYIEGSAADLLVQEIYLRSMLLYNPGIIESPAEAASAAGE